MSRRETDLRVDGQDDELRRRDNHLLRIVKSRRGFLCLAGGAAAGFLLRHQSARLQNEQQNDIIQGFKDQQAQAARDREQSIGPEPGISWEIKNWDLLLPIDDIDAYVNLHPTHRITLTLGGPSGTRYSQIIFKKNEDHVWDSDIDIREVDGRSVYVLQTKPGSSAPGMPASFYARIESHDGVVAEKEQDIPVIAYSEKLIPDDMAHPRVFSDENPRTTGVDQRTLDDLGQLASDLSPYTFTRSNVYLQRKLSPVDPSLFTYGLIDLQVDSDILKNGANNDANFYITLHAMMDVVFEPYIRARDNNATLLVPFVPKIQNSPLSEAFKFSDYVPSAKRETGDANFLNGIPARKLPDIVSVLRLFPDEFLQKFQSLDDTQKSLTRTNIAQAVTALDDIAKLRRRPSDINDLIPDFQRIKAAVGV